MPGGEGMAAHRSLPAGDSPMDRGVFKELDTTAGLGNAAQLLSSPLPTPPTHMHPLTYSEAHS